MAEPYARRVQQIRRDSGIMPREEVERRRNDMLMQAGLNVAQQGIGALTGGLLKSEGFRQATTPDRMLREEAAKRALERRFIRAQGGLVENQAAQIPYTTVDNMYKSRINPYMVEGGKNWRHQKLMQNKLDILNRKLAAKGKGGGSGGYYRYKGVYYTRRNLEAVRKQLTKSIRSYKGELKNNAIASLGRVNNVLNTPHYSRKHAKEQEDFDPKKIGNAGLDLGQVSGSLTTLEEDSDRSAKTFLRIKGESISVNTKAEGDANWVNLSPAQVQKLAGPAESLAVWTGALDDYGKKKYVVINWRDITDKSKDAIRAWMRRSEIASEDMHQKATAATAASGTGSSDATRPVVESLAPKPTKTKQGDDGTKEDVGERKKISVGTRDQWIAELKQISHTRWEETMTEASRSEAKRRRAMIIRDYPDYADKVPSLPGK